MPRSRIRGEVGPSGGVGGGASRNDFVLRSPMLQHHHLGSISSADSNSLNYNSSHPTSPLLGGGGSVGQPSPARHHRSRHFNPIQESQQHQMQPLYQEPYENCVELGSPSKSPPASPLESRHSGSTTSSSGASKTPMAVANNTLSKGSGSIGAAGEQPTLQLRKGRTYEKKCQMVVSDL